MWLPTPLYEALPYIYIVGGVVFNSITLFLGVASFEYAPAFIAAGLLSICWGTIIFAKRFRARSLNAQAIHSEPA